MITLKRIPTTDAHAYLVVHDGLTCAFRTLLLALKYIYDNQPR